MQLRDPAPHMVRLHRQQIDTCSGSGRGQALQRLAVHHQRARRQPPLDLEVLQVAQQLGRQRRDGGVGHVDYGLGNSRDSPALAISPMRTRKSVPMSAL